MRETWHRTAGLLRALGSPVRYQIVKLLCTGKHSPSALAAKLKRRLPVISQHLAALCALDVVRFEYAGQRVQYWMKYRSIGELLAKAERIAGEMRVEPKE